MMKVVGPIPHATADPFAPVSIRNPDAPMSKEELDKIVAGPFSRAGDAIDCVLILGGLEAPFTASPNDQEEYGRQIYAAIVNYYDV